jgi:O-succinylbenzoate synthase
MSFDHLPKANKVLAGFCQAYSLDPAKCQLYDMNKRVADHETLGQVQPAAAFWISCCACYVLERLQQAGDMYSRVAEACNSPALMCRVGASSSSELC